MLAMMGATLGGMVGWWLGNLIGFTTAFIVSIFASGIGWYFGVRFYQEYL